MGANPNSRIGAARLVGRIANPSGNFRDRPGAFVCSALPRVWLALPEVLEPILSKGQR